MTPMPASMLIQTERPSLGRLVVLRVGNWRRRLLLRRDFRGRARKDVLSVRDEEVEENEEMFEVFDFVGEDVPIQLVKESRFDLVPNVADPLPLGSPKCPKETAVSNP